jgi:uncharacterized protein YkwD
MHIRTQRSVLPLALALAGALLAAFAMTFAAGNRAAALTNCSVTHDSNDSEELAFLGLINTYRAQNGLSALTISTNLNRGAAWMSEDLAKNHYFSHTDSLGRSPYQRAIDCGYPSGAGENLAAGTAWSSAQSAFNAWQSSPGHNANMLGTYYQQIGIARHYLAGSQYGWYWTTTFGTTNDGTGGGGAGNPTNTPAATSTPTRTPTPAQATATPTAIPPTATPTPNQGGGQNPTSTPTSAQPTATPTSAQPTATATPTSNGSGTPTPTSTPTATASPTPASTPTTTPSATVTPTPTTTGTPSLALSPGTNFVAWPGGNVAPSQVFGPNSGIKVVYSWDAATGQWRRYFPGLPAYLNNLNTLTNGGAYWIIANKASQFQVSQ